MYYKEIVIIIIMFILSGMFLVINYKKAQNDFEKVLFIFISVAIWIPAILYYLDRFNVPSLLGYTDNLDSKDWLNNLMSYFCVLITTLINSAFLIFVTREQINRTYNDNIEINKENQRMQNMPLLKYNISNEKISNEFWEENVKWFPPKNPLYGSTIDSLDFTFSIQNIGLNTVKKCYLKIESPVLRNVEIFEFFNQSSIEKGEIKSKEFIVPSIIKGTYKFIITVYYQDLLKNWYSQECNFNVSINNIYDKSGNVNTFDSFFVKDEKLLNGKPKIIKNINK